MTKTGFPSLDAPGEGYLFVVTYGRSGSTVTQNLLNSIPGYCIRGENGNLLYHLARGTLIPTKLDNFIWRREDIARPPKAQRPFLAGIIGTPADPWYGAEAVDPERLGRALADVFVREVLHPPEGTRVAGFKEIRWHEDARFFPDFLRIVRRIFPRARFLFQTRDHEAVARSRWWGTKPRDAVLAELARAEALYSAFMAENPECSCLVRHEDYAAGPEAARKIFDFLGEPFDPDRVAAVLGRLLEH